MVSSRIRTKVNSEICRKAMNPKIRPIILLIISWILFWGLVFFLSSCSVGKQINYHNKQSERHYKKALAKGYIPLIDSTEISGVLSVDLNQRFVSELPNTILNKLYESKNEIGVIDEKKAALIITDFIEKEVPKYINIDSMLVLLNSEGDSIGYIKMKSDTTGLIIDAMYVSQEKIYLDKSFFDYLGINTWRKKALVGLLTILIVALFLWKLIK